MSLVLANGIKAPLLELERAFFNTLEICLFKNDHIPAGTDTIANYTEADFTGYNAKPLNDFAAAYLNASNQGEIDAVVKIWTQTGAAVANNIYGYFIRTTGGTLVLAERAVGAPFNMNAAGLVYVVYPIILLDTMP